MCVTAAVFCNMTRCVTTCGTIAVLCHAAVLCIVTRCVCSVSQCDVCYSVTRCVTMCGTTAVLCCDVMHCNVW